MPNFSRRTKPFPGESTEMLLANIEIARDLGRGSLREAAHEMLDGVRRVDAALPLEDALNVLDRMLDNISGFVSGRVAMIVPKHMIDPEDLARAIKRGQELAEEHGW